MIEFIRYEKNSEYQYGAVVLTNNDSIPQFFYLCKENDLKEILSNVVSISESLFKLYSLYPNKLLEFRKLKTEQKNTNLK